MFTFDNKKFKNMIFNQVKHLYNTNNAYHNIIINIIVGK